VSFEDELSDVLSVAGALDVDAHGAGGWRRAARRCGERLAPHVEELREGKRRGFRDSGWMKPSVSWVVQPVEAGTRLKWSDPDAGRERHRLPVIDERQVCVVVDLEVLGLARESVGGRGRCRLRRG